MKEDYIVNKLKVTGFIVIIACLLTACGQQKNDSRTTIEFFLGKRECIATFQSLIDKFEEQNPDIHVKMSAPSEPISILKTRLIKNDEPDMVAILGDSSYTSLVDSDMFMDLTGEDVLNQVKPVYADMTKQLQSVSKEATYAIAYAGNANVVLYNKDIFKEQGLTVPKTWTEYTTLCKQLQTKEITMTADQFGYQSANSVIYFVVIVLISLFQMKVLNKREVQL